MHPHQLVVPLMHAGLPIPKAVEDAAQDGLCVGGGRGEKGMCHRTNGGFGSQRGGLFNRQNPGETNLGSVNIGSVWLNVQGNSGDKHLL